MWTQFEQTNGQTEVFDGIYQKLQLVTIIHVPAQTAEEVRNHVFHEFLHTQEKSLHLLSLFVGRCTFNWHTKIWVFWCKFKDLRTKSHWRNSQSTTEIQRAQQALLWVLEPKADTWSSDVYHRQRKLPKLSETDKYTPIFVFPGLHTLDDT